jgi:hypothetical protein
MSNTILGARFVSAGKKFFEVVPESLDAEENFRPGIGISSTEEAYSFLGLDVLTVSSDGTVFESDGGFGQEQYEMGFSFASGDVVGIAVDFDSDPDSIIVRGFVNGNPMVGGAQLHLSNLPKVPYRAAAITNYGKIQFHLRATAAQLGNRIPLGYSPWEDS